MGLDHRLLRIVMFGVEFGGFVVVVLGVGVVGVRQVGMVAGFFVVAGLMGVGGGVVVAGGVLVVPGGFAVMLDRVFVRHGFAGIGGLNWLRSRNWGQVQPTPQPRQSGGNPVKTRWNLRHRGEQQGRKRVGTCPHCPCFSTPQGPGNF